MRQLIQEVLEQAIRHQLIAIRQQAEHIEVLRDFARGILRFLFLLQLFQFLHLLPLRIQVRIYFRSRWLLLHFLIVFLLLLNLLNLLLDIFQLLLFLVLFILLQCLGFFHRHVKPQLENLHLIHAGKPIDHRF